ncbi:MAG: deoxyuridine 5'-triphosphate nucleotidohydrolase [Chloroflexi bacterium]|nr:deoxyuridine 5'-triphosphate nucleotidohydrolase [Chloroflexota bacterium]
MEDSADIPPGGALGREALLHLLTAVPPLVEGLNSPQEQVQPNGIDLTVREVALFSGPGRLSPTQRVLSSLSPLTFDGLGVLELMPGPYLVTFNEVVHLPKDIMALGRTRSTLLRCGVALHTAVWDAGYSGRSQSLMMVYHPYGFRLARDSRVMQLVFFSVSGPSPEGYRGRYQGENV